MLKIRTLILLVLMTIGLLSFAAVVYANVLGVMVSYKRDELTIMDKAGSTSSYTVTKDTQIMSRAGSSIKLGVIRPGTRLSVVAQGGVAKTVVILEVPK